MPVDRLPSWGLAITPVDGGKKGRGTALKFLAEAFAGLPMPVLGHIHDGALIFDLRCLEDEAGFLAQLSHLSP